MKALVYNKDQLTLSEVPQPGPQDDEVLLKIRLAGICNTDLEIIKGYMGFTGILGHEFVADVVEGDSHWVGQRVVGEINLACGFCDYCQREMKSHCRNRTTLGIDRKDGAFATYMTLPANNLHIIPTTVTDEQAVFVEPLAAACQILDQVDISGNDNIVLIGAGKLGMLCAQVLNRTDANLSVIIRHDKQANLLQKWGIRAVRRESVENSTASIVVDCTGTESGFSDALEIIRPKGTIVLKSTYQGHPSANLTQVAVDEIHIVGSRCGPFDKALKLLEEKRIDVESMIEETYPLEEAITAINFAGQKGILKVLLKP